MRQSKCRACDKPIQRGRYCESCSNDKVHDGYSLGELCEAYDWVKDMKDERKPIDATLNRRVEADEQHLIAAAVKYFTGGLATFYWDGKQTRVTASGYRDG